MPEGIGKRFSLEIADPEQEDRYNPYAPWHVVIAELRKLPEGGALVINRLEDVKRNVL